MATTAEPISEGVTKARWTRLAALGLFLAGLAPLLMFLAGLVWGLEFGDDAGFFLVTTFIGVIGSFLVLRFGAWSKVVGIVASLLMVMALFWTAFGLASPNSFFDFVPGLLVVPGALIAIGANIGAFVAGRRGHVSPGATGGERTVIRTYLSVVVGLALISGILTFTSRSSVAETEADTRVSLKNFEFDAETYEFAAGSTVLVRNDDPFLHTFTIEALNIDITLTPGSEKLVEIPSESGEFVVFCRPHTTEPEDPAPDDMAARVTIQ